MIPWQLLDSVPASAGAGEMCLFRHGTEFSIRVAGQELMNSTVHYSEDKLAELACALVARRPHARVLIGGLGMGFTAAAALRALGSDAEVVVAEIFAAVVRWNLGELAHLTGNALIDPRVMVREIDVVQLLRTCPALSWDAILLDVDNGPQAMTRPGNAWLYSPAGLSTAKTVLRPQGVLAVWSAADNNAFGKILRRAGFDVQEVREREREGRGRKKHTIWLGVCRGV